MKTLKSVRIVKFIYVFVLILFLGASIYGQAPVKKRVYTTQRLTDQAPSIDGKLDDRAWQNVTWEGDFLQRLPYEGQLPSQKTAFKIIYDEKNLYIALRAYDTEPDKIVRQLSRRDTLDGDWMTVQLDSFNDRRTAFIFAVNAEGVKYDKTMSNDGNDEDVSWDPVWFVKTSVDNEGWIAEIRIPFSQLRFSNNDVQTWGMQASRFLFRKEERSDWQRIPKNASGYVNRFGQLEGIKGISHRRQMELLPYAVGKLDNFQKEVGNPFATGHSSKAEFGLDGKVGISSHLTMDFTINPDFGQVEADPSVVNLSAYETFFSEKRPFFIEGRNIMDFQMMSGTSDFSSDNLFYSRRIGRDPHYIPNTGQNEYMKIPTNASILGAFKLTGKTQNGFSIGILESVTGREKAEIDYLGERRFETVEPLTNYFLMRLQKDFDKGNTIIGGMVTATNRNLKDSEPNLSFLHKSAYTGGFDFYHTWRNKTYYVSFNSIFSTVQGDKVAILNTQLSSVHYYQRPDASHIKFNPNRTSLSGYGGNFEIGKGGNSHFKYFGGATWRSPGLELNDMGYLRSADRIMEWACASYSIWKPTSIFLSYSLSANQWIGWDFGGNRIYSGTNLGLNTQLKNYWRVYWNAELNDSQISPTSLRGGPSLKLPATFGTYISVTSDDRQLFIASLGVNLIHGAHDWNKTQDYSLDLSYRPISNLYISVSPGFTVNKKILQYVGTRELNDSPGTKRYVFASLSQKTLSLTFRLNYSITPDLSIQFYGQPFISAGNYTNFKHITNPRAAVFDDRFHNYTADQIHFDDAGNSYSIDEDSNHTTDYTFTNPNFNFLQFRSNLVLRWEYNPGSTVYLVWSQGRTGITSDGDFSFKDDLKDLFKVSPYDVFLIKFTYRFNL